ncbi:MAG: putative quinol monooxygenase [Rhodanobacteraceae bacterium]
MIRLVTRFVARDETTAAKFADLLLRLQETVPSEPGNVIYEVLESAEDPMVFFCLESWNSPAAVNAHIRSNEEAGVNAEAADLLAAAPETMTLRSIE